MIKWHCVLSFHFSLYYKIHVVQYGDQRKTALADRLLEVAESRNDTCVDVTDGRCTVSIVTPLMARVHQLPEAGETVFVYAGGNCDRSQARIFLFMTSTVMAGLPVGITTYETLEKGF